MIWSLGYILAEFWPRNLSQAERLGNGGVIHRGRFSGPGDHSRPILVDFCRVTARPTIRDLRIVIFGQLRLLRLQHCDIEKIETSLRPQHCVLTGQMSVHATEGMSAVDTGQMSAVETTQMSSAETRQMINSETGQRPVLPVDIYLVSAEEICLVLTADICPVSTVSTEDSCPVSTAHICSQHSEQVHTAKHDPACSEHMFMHILQSTLASARRVGQ